MMGGTPLRAWCTASGHAQDAGASAAARWPGVAPARANRPTLGAGSQERSQEPADFRRDQQEQPMQPIESKGPGVVGRAGLEPATYGLKVPRGNQADQRLGSAGSQDRPMRDRATARGLAGVVRSLQAGAAGLLMAGAAWAQDSAMPADLVWVCAYSDDGVRCFDTVFESPTLVDCGNERPLTAYEGGAGVMVLTDAEGRRHSFAYGSRSYNVRGGPGNLDVIRLFPVEPESFGFAGDFEHCATYVR